MKFILIVGITAVLITATVLLIAHAKRVCRYATIFLDHY